jgi:hypothetical protein
MLDESWTQRRLSFRPEHHVVTLIVAAAAWRTVNSDEGDAVSHGGATASGFFQHLFTHLLTAYLGMP